MDTLVVQDVFLSDTPFETLGDSLQIAPFWNNSPLYCWVVKSQKNIGVSDLKMLVPPFHTPSADHF